MDQFQCRIDHCKPFEGLSPSLRLSRSKISLGKFFCRAFRHFGNGAPEGFELRPIGERTFGAGVFNCTDRFTASKAHTRPASASLLHPPQPPPLRHAFELVRAVILEA